MSSKLTINISEEELKVMNDADFFYHKHAITKKLYKIFANLKQEIRISEIFREFLFPKGTDITTGKISKGENYRQLPFIILDFPRLFSSEDIFAFRSMFLWGNYFLFTLHLAGVSKEKYAPRLADNLVELKEQNIYFYIHDDQWEHALEPAYYKLLKNMEEIEIKEKMLQQPFIKLAKKLPLNKWGDIVSEGKNSFDLFFKNMIY